jgi:hypothetical protein
MSPAVATSWITPPRLAAQLGVDVHAILAWIKAGELRAVNLAVNANGKRPRWKIGVADLESFLARRAATPPIKAVHRRRHQEGITEFF